MQCTGKRANAGWAYEPAVWCRQAILCILPLNASSEGNAHPVFATRIRQGQLQ